MPSARMLFWNGRKLRIGRNPNLECVVRHPQRKMVSREHARIERSPDNAAVICDLDSKNGTFVNGRRISQPTTIVHGDHIQLSPLGPEFIFVSIAPPMKRAAQVRLATRGDSFPIISAETRHSRIIKPTFPAALSKSENSSTLMDSADQQPLSASCSIRSGTGRRLDSDRLWVNQSALIQQPLTPSIRTIASDCLSRHATGNQWIATLICESTHRVVPYTVSRFLGIWLLSFV